MRPQSHSWFTALAVVIIVGIVAEARLLAQPPPIGTGGVSPWLNAVDVLQQAFTGPLARGLSLIAIVIGGLMFALVKAVARRRSPGSSSVWEWQWEPRTS